MKQFGEFLKTTALGGLFVMLPVLMLYLLISEALELVVALATPIADLFPKGTFDKIWASRICREGKAKSQVLLTPRRKRLRVLPQIMASQYQCSAESLLRISWI